MFGITRTLSRFYSRRAIHLMHGFEQTCLAEKRRVEETLRISGVLTPGKQLEDFLHMNKLASRHETVFQVLQRATGFLAQMGEKFYGKNQVKKYHRRFLSHASRFEVILGSPMLTNAGRTDKSVSSCAIPQVNLSTMRRIEIAKIVSDYHTRGMGTGFCLDNLENPVEMIKYLNQIATHEIQRGEIERSVGNMGVLSIDHPQVLSFIRVRVDNPQIREWKFNLSINLTDKFYKAWSEQSPFVLRNGAFINPKVLMRQIAENAHATGDPGLIFMDRINELNRLPQIGQYKAVVPCGEVSLHEGEVCQFAYLNLPRFVMNGKINKGALRRAIHSTVVMLDNAVEANIERMPNSQSAEIISSIRRIGIGVCGVAEILLAMGLSYDSEEARTLVSNIMSFINFESKCASVELAKNRGPFKHFTHPQTRKDLFIDPFANYPTTFVSAKDWKRLKERFTIYKIRNLATTILPPTGRSSIIAGVTGSIEPPFKLIADRFFKNALQRECAIHGYDADFQSIYKCVNALGSIQETTLPDSIKRIFKTALEISAEEHIKMTAAFQRHTDEGISKTVNLPSDTTIEDVEKVLISAYNLNLKGITVYRDGCRQLQPKTLNLTSSDSLTSPTITDPIYGSVSVSNRIQKLLASPLLKRLNGIHQNGTDFLIDPRLSTTRFEHSVGVMILTKMLGGNESAQISALLHDVSHTVFSHVIDISFGYEKQDYHNQAFKRFMHSEIAQKIIQECQLTPSELDCESIPFVKGKGLNADRLDYAIRDLRSVNGIFQPEYSSILNGLVVEEDGEIQCRDIETARLLFRKFLQANQEIYFNPKSEVAALVMATILQKMIQLNLLNETDLFSTDDVVISKILVSPFRNIYESIGPDIKFQLSDTKTTHSPVLRKLRYIDPKIAEMPGRLTDHCSASKAKLLRYLTTPTNVYYQIPLLESLS